MNTNPKSLSYNKVNFKQNTVKIYENYSYTE